MALEPLKESLTEDLILEVHSRRVVGGSSCPNMKRADGVNQVEYEKAVNFGAQADNVRKIIRGERDLKIPPAKRIVKAKPDGGMRYIDAPGLEVAHVAGLLLEHGLNHWQPKHPFYGYPRPILSTGAMGRDAAIAYLLESRKPGLWVVKNDIRKAFDSIPPTEIERLLKTVYQDPDLHLARRILQMPFQWPDQRIEERLCGVPQGLSLSGLVLGLALRDLPAALEGVSVGMVIYVDDIIVLTETESKAHAAFNDMKNYLEARGLSLKFNEKDSIIRPGTPVQYLGDEVIEWEG